MPSSSLYRRYRPRTFGEVIGQRVAVRVMQNSLRANRVSSTWLLTGGWGSGKTTSARLLAKAVNCLDFDSENAEPCNKCRSCKAINRGSSPDVLEIDAASHGRVDDIRKLRESATHRPTLSSRKVYIIDEVHQVSRDGFDALLKLLEEPPAHVMFILATTDPEKIPNTILSRCLRLDFKRISVNDAADSIRHICEAESQPIAEAAVIELARAANGSLRDAQSLLEQASRLCDGHEIKASEVRRMLGLASPVLIENLVDYIADRDASAALNSLEDAFSKGLDAISIANGLVERLRNLLLITLGIINAPKNTPWEYESKRLSMANVRAVIEEFAFNWQDSRNDPFASQIMLEVKFSRAIALLKKAT